MKARELLINSIDQLEAGIFGYQSRINHIKKVKEFLNSNDNAIDAWLVWYGEGDIAPICILFPPRFPEACYKIQKIKFIYEN